jgi:hypothetical protein
MRGYILASFFFFWILLLVLFDLFHLVFGAIKIMAAGCWMLLGITRWALARAVCAPLASKQARKTALDPGIARQGWHSKPLRSYKPWYVCVYVYIIVYIYNMYIDISISVLYDIMVYYVYDDGYNWTYPIKVTRLQQCLFKWLVRSLH